ncbi:hypothetical protein DINM_004926 [Dirofilaria immitis]|nr:hypothetical protein [Dirofilaria immitis]
MDEESKQSSEKVEFQMKSEDFPALPGTSPRSEPNEIMIPTGNSSLQINDSNVGFVSESGPNFSTRLLSQAGINIETYPDGTMTNIPPSMMTDQFGILGFLAAYRGMHVNPNIAPLVIGQNAELIGLGMNSELEVPDPSGHGRCEIHRNYGGPWADKLSHAPHTDTKEADHGRMGVLSCYNPAMLHSLNDYYNPHRRMCLLQIPEVYKTNVLIREKLAKIKFPSLKEDALFYLFYNYPGEQYQIAAAHELHVRDWRYHKMERKWLRRSNFGSVIQHAVVFERGTYNVFDPVHWRKISKEMTIEYKDLERQPELPRNMKVFFEP